MHDHVGIIATAVLPTRDIDEAIDFYRRLGFTLDRFSDRYALVVRDGHESFHLEVHDDVDIEANRAAVYLNVPVVDDWYRRWLTEGVDVGNVADEPWGMRAFRLTDPSGNTVRVGSNR